MASKRRTNRYNSGQGDERRMARRLDDLAEFEEFQNDILPKLREMIKKGAPADKIYEFSQSYMAARAVTIGITSQNETAALGAIKEVLDRGVGKAADKLEVTKKYEKLSDEELESLLKSQQQEAEESESKH